MPQVTLHHFNYPIRTISSRRPDAAPPTQPFPLLRLPFSIRRRIYILAGLFSGFKVHLNYDPPDDEEELWNPDLEPFCTRFLSCKNLEEIPQQNEIAPWSLQLSHFIDGPFPYPQIMLDRDILAPRGESPDGESYSLPEEDLPFQLLYVSRKVALEVKKIFWSENFFTIARPDIGGLSFLHSLSPLSLRLMTTLSIRLNYWGNKLEWNDGERFKDEVPDCHVGCPTYGHQDKIGIPKAPKELAAMKEWRALCGHLAKTITPGSLKLWIFCDVEDEKAARLVLEPLDQLPPLKDCGIRLSYEPSQSLVSLATSTARRLMKVTIPNEKPFPFLKLPFELQIKILEYTALLAPRPIMWSTRSLNTRPHLIISSQEPEHMYRAAECCRLCGNEEDICYCQYKHSSYCSTCTCWVFPGELFLISRQLRSLALFLFYSRNIFVTVYMIQLSYREDYVGFSLLDFFRSIPVEGRQYLRNVKWVSGPTMNKDWIQAMDVCAEQFDLSKLTLTIDLSSVEMWDYGHFSDGQEEEDWVLNRHLDCWQTGLQMSTSMARYNGWKDVFWNLEFRCDERFSGVVNRMEAVLEKITKGPDYEALHRRKVSKSRRPLVWSDNLLRRHIALWDEAVRKHNYDHLWLET